MSANAFDPADLIDRTMVGFDISQLPTAREQHELVVAFRNEGTKSSDPIARRTLLRRHALVIAGGVYQFKNDDADSRELLSYGARSLLKAALSYRRGEGGDFCDHALRAINEDLSKAFPHLRDTGDAGRFTPTEALFRLKEALMTSWQEWKRDNVESQQRAKLEQQQRLKALRKLRASLTRRQFEALPFLHLPHVDAAKRLGTTAPYVNQLGVKSRRRVGAPSTLAILQTAVIAGIELGIPEPKEGTTISRTERDILDLLAQNKTDAEIRAQLGINIHQLATRLRSLKEMSGCQTRVGLALFGQLHELEVVEEDIEPAHEALDDFPPQYHKVLWLLHLPPKEIAVITGISQNTVNKYIPFSREIAGVTTTAALAVKLYRRGLPYDIKKPKQTLVSRLTPVRAWVAERIELDNPDIAAGTDMRHPYVSQIINDLKDMTGARTREELALMIAKYGASEQLPLENLAERLGREKLDRGTAEALLRATNDRERGAIVARYFGTTLKPWQEIADERGITIHNAEAAAGLGVAKMRRVREATPVTHEPRHHAAVPQA